MDTNNVFNEKDESELDIEDLSKVHNINYDNDILHPTGRTVEFNDGRANEIEVRYASVFFEPEVGANFETPAFKYVYNTVKKEIDKITFKYDLSSWILWYALRIDDMSKHCHYGGTPCIMTQIPYGTYDLNRAKELIISYVTELLALLNQEYAVVYFDANTAFGIKCTYDPEVLEYGVPKLVSSEVTDLNELKTISCIINTTLKTAGLDLQNIIQDRNKDSQSFGVPMYLYVSKNPLNVSQCIMMSATYMNHGKYNTPVSSFVNAVKEEIESSMLAFINYTII